VTEFLQGVLAKFKAVGLRLSASLEASLDALVKKKLATTTCTGRWWS